MMRSNFWLISAILLSVPFSEAVSQKLLNPKADYSQGRYFNYTNSEPGADITTTAIYFDKKGFLWSGGYTGVYRFDGMEYRGFPSGTTDKTGIAGNQVSSITEDRHGELWIATFGALNLLERKTWTFRHFFPDSTNLMDPSNRIHYIYPDSKGLLWLITGGDLFNFDPGKNKFRRFEIDSLSHRREMNAASRPGKLLEDREGRIWLATPYGLYCYDPAGDEFRSFHHTRGNNGSLPGNDITFITEDKTGKLWCAVNGHGLVLVSDPKQGIFLKIENRVRKNLQADFDNILTLLPDSKGNIWSFGYGTVSCFNPLQNQSKNYILPPQNEFLPIYHFPELRFEFAFEDGKGDIWFLHSLEGFLFRFDPDAETLRLSFVPNWSVFNAMVDNSGSFWFACGRNNIWSFTTDGIPFTVTPVANEFNVMGVRCNTITEDDRFLWIVLSSGIYRSKKNGMNFSFDPVKFFFPDGSSYASSILRDKDNNIWFARDNGTISALHPNRIDYTDYTLPEGHTGPVTDMRQDKNGNIWFISPYVIFRKGRDENIISMYSITNDSLSDYISGGLFNVFIDSKDNMWFASFGNGIYSLNIETGRVKFYGPSQGLDMPFGDYCMRIAEDSKGKIMALYFMKGLFSLDPDLGHFSKIGSDHHLTEARIFMDLFIDNNDRIVLSHSEGFTFFDSGKNKIDNVVHPMPTGKAIMFKTREGNLLFCSGNQLLHFRDTMTINTSVPQVLITSLLVNGKEYSDFNNGASDITDVDRIELDHRENNLRISFVALNYRHASRNMYRYFLKGIDNDTVTVGADFRFAEYKKIRPGTYTFWVTGSNDDKVWNETGRTLEITINRPWYSSGLFYVLTFFIISSTIILIFQWRTRYLRHEKEMMEKIVEERTAELKQKNMQIEELDRVKTRFFAEISHEIRTPLSLIVGPVETMISEKEGEDDEFTVKWLKVIRRNGKRLLELVNQLLDISKLDAGKMKLILEKSDIFKNLRILAAGFQSVAETRKIEFIVRIPDEPLLEYFDRDKTEKITSNLLINAFKFTPAGGKVVCDIRSICLDITGKSPVLHITISDTGTGIRREDIDKIFDRFFSMDGEWDSDGRGTGIGLALTSEFVKMMHGQIHVSSEPGKGSEFSVSIPLGIGHLNENDYFLVDSVGDELTEKDCIPYSVIETSVPNSDTDQNKQQLLVIEDNDDLRHFLRDNLSNDFTVIESGNGRSGLESALSRIPDIIITDIIMHDLNGLDICRQLKEDERTSHIPIIMLTARTTADDRIAGLKSGADDYLFKPFDIHELKARIVNLLNQRQILKKRFGLLTGYELQAADIESVDEKFLKKVSEIIKNNIRDFDFDVGALQEKLGMSRVHLYRKIKAIAGISPHDMIYNYRMQEAARLIKSKSGNYAEISFSVGFSNPAYFSKWFRDYYGVSPREYFTQINNAKDQTL
jgi:signal transduction histidine kinase/ligand-binding sensor domain-containing protein/AraC-like DNA-binding protein